MPAGAPRTISLSPPEMVELGKEMVKWIIDNDKVINILHLSEWYTIHKMFTYNQWKTFLQRAEFIPYYEKALKLIGRKYLDKTSNVREGASQRFLRTYFNDLREREDQEAKDSAIIAKFVDEPEDMQELKNKLDDLSAQLSPSMRNIDDSNTISDK